MRAIEMSDIPTTRSRAIIQCRAASALALDNKRNRNVELVGYLSGLDRS
jgi:hypothetical protein